MITIDFETRSKVDIRKCGSSVYAQDASTNVLCLAYKHQGESVQIWKPGDPTPESLLDAVSWGVEDIEAHNVLFERNIWHHIMHKRQGWPDVKFDRWRCSMAACCRLTLPRSLEAAGSALGTSIQKDDEGHKVMLRLSKPKRPSKADPGIWDNDPEKFEKLYAYCKQDVLAESDISDSIEPLTKSELKVWQLDQRINLRGLAVDREAIQNALIIVEQVYEDCCQRINQVTGGVISTPKQVAAISSFIEKHVGEKPKSLSAETVNEWLNNKQLPDMVRSVLEIRQAASKASTAKLKSMLARCDDDGRVRGNLVYHGAATGRWAGSGIQIQNYPRGVLSNDEIELTHRMLPSQNGRLLDLLLGPPIDCISSSLRSMIRAEQGNRLLVCDFASIEARVLAWIAGEGDLLDQFVSGDDVYKSMAAKIYDVQDDDVSKTQRHVGKTAILGLGYGMGWKSFVETCQRMAGVTIDNAMSKRVVGVYRTTNGKIKNFWSSLGTACIRAIETKHLHHVGCLEIACDTEWLRIKLPSGRQLHYRKPHLVEVVAPWSKGHIGVIHGSESLLPKLESFGIDVGERFGGHWIDCDVPHDANRKLAQAGIKAQLKKKEPQLIKQIQFWGVNSLTKKWSKQRTYGAKLVENVVQAVARDFLVEAMFRCENAGYSIVATVHDEIISERKIGEGRLKDFEDLMRRMPRWGLGCPIEVEGFEAERYRK